MGALFLLEVFCFLTVYLTISTAGLTLPLNQALDSPGSLTTTFLNVSNADALPRCTGSLIWTGSTGYDAQFTENCYRAWRIFFMADFRVHKNAEFEFLQQGVTASYPGLPKMATPRRYVMNACTIVIVNIADIPSGILPSEPPGPFPRSDMGRFSDFLAPINAVRSTCLGRKKELGWAVAGRQQAMAILMFSTNAPIDRIVPRSDPITGAVGGLDTVA